MFDPVKSFLHPHIGRLTVRTYFVLIALALLYLTLFTIAFRQVGAQAASLSYVFIAVVAWFYGRNLGLLAVLVCILVTATSFGPVPIPQMTLGIGLFFGVAFALGAVSRLYLKLKSTEIQLRQEHAKSEMILGNIFPKKIVERLKNGEVLIADKYLETTILFSDLVGFTDLTKTMKPHDLVMLLDRVITGFDALSERFGIEKIKTIGDAYLVVSGLPDENSDHAPSISRMALEMLLFIEEFNCNEGTNLQIRIGIHSGSVIGGVIGPKKFTFDLWGDTVNLASRLEVTGVSGKIQVSQATHELLKDKFRFEIRDPFEIKGHGEVQTYFLIEEITP